MAVTISRVGTPPPTPEIQAVGRQFLAERRDRPMCGFYQKASVAVVAKAYHLISSGWLGKISANERGTEYYMPGENGTGPYCVRLDPVSGQGYCDCEAGVICKHFTVVQVLKGWCSHWPPSPFAKPFPQD
jgi:hypothetical protein